MSYKLIALDCDNTLLDEYGNISELNKQVIAALKKKGVDFIIATGRNDILARDYAEELELEAPIIGCNGGIVTNLFTNEVFRINAIDEDSVSRIIDYFEQNDLLFKVLTPDACYTNDEMAMKLGLSQIVKKYTRVLKYELPYYFAEDIAQLRSIKNILKVVFIDDDKEKRLQVQSDLRRIPKINVHTAGFNCVDTIAEGSTKGIALGDYARTKGISREEIIAFGDGENDLSMIEYAGLGVAMINGDEKLKAAADRVTEYDNTDGGVGHTLADIFGLEL